MKTYNIAIIGAGPAGYFSAQALQNLEDETREFRVDLFEKLPTPWGLVRSGVAPDHQKIKTVSKVFEKIAAHKNFRLFANIELGLDVSLEDLNGYYDAVIIATGASIGKKLNIPGESLKNSLSSAAFVPWYNGHPDFVDLKVNLNCKSAVVIGAGNVAIDVGRILLKDIEELEKTDISISALEDLRKSEIKEVIICGRRGPENAQFTTPELRELPKISNINVDFDNSQIKDAINRTLANGMYDEKEIRGNLETMLQISESHKAGFEKTLKFKFLLNPFEIIGKNEVSGMHFKLNKVRDNSVIETDIDLKIDCGIIISAIGYEPMAIDTLTPAKGKFENIAGKIRDNLYVVGWAKRGATGVIGTNKSDASEVVKLLVSNLQKPKGVSAPEKCIKQSKEIINQAAWEKINKKEIEMGALSNKPRNKITNREELISLSR